jgi:hypothetical protein
MVCSPKSVALKAYNRGVIKTMSVYVLTVFCVAWFVSRHHPTGLLAYVLAILPAIPIVGMLAVMGIYLRDEKDEFLRWITIQALLWATGVVLAWTTAVGFLESFAKVNAPPLFWVFVVYWLVFGAVQYWLQRQYRKGGDD